MWTLKSASISVNCPLSSTAITGQWRSGTRYDPTGPRSSFIGKTILAHLPPVCRKISVQVGKAPHSLDAMAISRSRIASLICSHCLVLFNHYYYFFPLLPLANPCYSFPTCMVQGSNLTNPRHPLIRRLSRFAHPLALEPVFAACTILVLLVQCASGQVPIQS